jgi:hypothetical protein
MAIRIIASLISLACVGLGAVVQYHVVMASAPDYFTLWAVTTTLGIVSLLISLIAKESP